MFHLFPPLREGVLNMNIEPMPLDRNRCADGGMTPEERALRKQWVEVSVLRPGILTVSAHNLIG